MKEAESLKFTVPTLRPYLRPRRVISMVSCFLQRSGVASLLTFVQSTVNITLETPGGHSSVPPPLTNAELLSEIVASLKPNTFTPHLTPQNPHHSLLQCLAQHGSDVPGRLRDAILSARSEKARAQLAKALAQEGGAPERYLLQTSQATTVFRSGVKANALPESGYALINHRIAIEESLDYVRHKVGLTLKAKAEEFGLGLELWGLRVAKDEGQGDLKVISIGNLEPAPSTPTYGSTPYEVLAGTIRHAWTAAGKADDLIVTPSIMTGKPLHASFFAAIGQSGSSSFNLQETPTHDSTGTSPETSSVMFRSRKASV
jgi:Gly-Xaa carboxypeptidase